MKSWFVTTRPSGLGNGSMPNIVTSKASVGSIFTRNKCNIWESVASKSEQVSLLFSHPEPNKAVSVISVEGADLLHYQENWLSILGEWYSEFGDSVVAEQKDLMIQSKALLARKIMTQNNFTSRVPQWWDYNLKKLTTIYTKRVETW